jgi:hypothetical protein
LHLIGVGLLFLLLSGVTLAETGESYDLTWSSVDGGGVMWSIGGDYTLGGTAGQPDAGMLAGGDYTLAGGFWSGGAAAIQEHAIHLPLVLRNH